MREHLATYLALARRDDVETESVPRFVEHAFRLLPRVPLRQWLLSVPERVRWILRDRHETFSPVLRILRRTVETARCAARMTLAGIDLSVYEDADGSARSGAKHTAIWFAGSLHV